MPRGETGFTAQSFNHDPFATVVIKSTTVGVMIRANTYEHSVDVEITPEEARLLAAALLLIADKGQ